MRCSKATMEMQKIVFMLALSLVLSWVVPFYGVMFNQIHPSYESALGVAYGFFMGCAIHVLIIFLWLVIKRSKIQKIEVVALLSSFCIMIVLTALSEGGHLSKM
jgi:hypothetical protein